MFDAHCHLQLPAFDADRAQVLSRAQAAGVERFCSCAVGPDDWQATLDLALSDRGVVLAGIGIHPFALAGWPEREDAAVLQQLEALLGAPQAPVAIVGECGLDARFVEAIPLSRQRALLDAQLALAQTYRLPIVLHCVRAQDPLLDLLQSFPDIRGLLFHAFGGSLEQARALLRWDAAFSFGGSLTLPSKKRRALVRGLPADRILVETDAPNGPPIRGQDSASNATAAQRIDPASLPAIVATLAAVREESAELWAERSTRNAQAFFGTM
ncbi:MAG: TatD family hydrolase [Myxococcales bacterium]|nr:TatD family hydrolase [Myxococcales bacterium]